ncbi:MAG: lysophospholipid acyltransferase family protein [Planctomycetota bacterium]|nr:lysophospholipid acyltransferase family protein [Planctomycetota bacterium]
MPDSPAIPNDFLPGSYTPRFTRVFSWWVEKMFRKAFCAVRIAQATDSTLAQAHEVSGPVIVVLNHIGWWDPLLSVLLARRYVPTRSVAAPMDIAQLRKFAFMRKLGIFGVNPENPGSLQAMSDYVLNDFRTATKPTLWITPQGTFADPRASIRLRPGVAAIAARASSERLPVRIISIAFEYAFWIDKRPEVLCRIEPCDPAQDSTPATSQPSDGSAPAPLSTADWHRAITRTMEHNAAELASLVIARDPSAFDAILGGGASGANALHNLWLRLRGVENRGLDVRQGARDIARGSSGSRVSGVRS